jgi:protein TonB
MGNSLSVRLRGIFQNKTEESWVARVKENARAFFELRGPAALAHGGAGAFDLIDERLEPGALRRRAASLLVHAVVIGVVLLLGRHTIGKLPHVDGILTQREPLPPWRPLPVVHADNTGRGEGSGGGRDGRLPTAGDLAPRSTMVFLHPHVPDNQEHVLPVEPTVFDAKATETRHVIELGLPWMKERNGSNGTNGEDGIGDKPGHTMGTGGHDGEGESGPDGPYAHGAYPLKCIYCPDPEYTDEARKAKMQGSVTLEVFVRADGRVGRVKIVKGLGLGLDERAMDAVRAWRFDPARDAARNPIAEWVTVETTYRLF